MYDMGAIMFMAVRPSHEGAVRRSSESEFQLAGN